MKKYRLHNITDFGVEIHDFCTENSLNNYIAIFVDPPYWVENLETNEKTYTGYTDNTGANVSRETLHESEIEWLSRHRSTEETESNTCSSNIRFSTSDKLISILCIISVLCMATLLLYFFLSSISSIADYLASFNWKIFNIL